MFSELRAGSISELRAGSVSEQLRAGDKVVAKAEIMADNYQALEDRTGTVTGGNGVAVYIRWDCGGAHDVIRRAEIDAAATLDLWQRTGG